MFLKKPLKKSLLITFAILLLSTTAFSVTPNEVTPIIAGGSAGDVLRSIDGGISWQKMTAPLPVQFSSLIKADNQYIGVGNAGMGVALRSTDGVTWSTVELADYYPTQILYANNQYILVDDGNSETSPDGINWVKHTIPISSSYPYAYYTGIAYGNGEYVAVGSAGDMLRTTPNQAAPGAENCIATSKDGVTWTLIIPTVMPFHSIIFANNQFVATGVGGVIGTSSDGIHWTEQQSGVTDDLGRIIWANNQYVTTNTTNDQPNDAYVLTSKDAIHWTKNSIPLIKGQILSLDALTFTNNLFVLTGNVIGEVPPLGGVLYTSSDAINWKLQVDGFHDANNNPEGLWAVA